jgi:hypothetical protein
MDGARTVTAVGYRMSGSKGHCALGPPCRLRASVNFQIFNGRFVVQPRTFPTR